MRCPLCGIRKARRACPAQGEHICSVCCGSKRLVEIACPSHCVYLAAAREHPPAVELRRHERDMDRLAPVVRDFSRLQGELFLLLAAAVVQDPPGELHRLLDEDVADAAGALAATLETAARGVIYEHRPVTRSAERLHGSFRALLEDLTTRGGGARVEREAVLVLRRLEEAARAGLQSERAFIDLLGRVLRPELPARAAVTPSDRLIVP